MFGDFWRNCFWRFLESTCSVNWRNRVRRSGVNVFGELGVLGEHVGDRHVVAYSPMAMSETYNR